MRSAIIPITTYLALAAIYSFLSGATARVDLASLSVLALATLVPTLIAARVRSWQQSLIACTVSPLIAMLTWDSIAHLLISKAEPFSVLSGMPQMYLAGLLSLTLLNGLITAATWALQGRFALDRASH